MSMTTDILKPERPAGFAALGGSEAVEWRKGKKLWGRKYRMQNGRCAICGEPKTPDEMTRDHIVPRSKGGGFGWDNIQLACEPCNTAKGNQ